MKNNTKKSVPYSDEALKYFQETNDNTEFMPEFTGNFDYMSYLLGDEMGVSFKTWLETPADKRWFEEEWEDVLFWKRNFYPSIDMIINDLHEKGFIPEGDFGIEIDW